MADFLTAYKKYVEPFEGGYVNNKADKGGETYAGIARNFWSAWPGWQFIDLVKQKRVIKTNEKFEDLSQSVIDFYRAMWDKQKFSLITSQEVANILFDFFVNSGSAAIKKVQELVGVSKDGSLGTNTLAAINKRNPATLHDQIKKARIDFYNAIVKRDPSQSVFLKGWMRRINSFPTLVKIAVPLVLIISVVFVYLLINSKT